MTKNIALGIRPTGFETFGPGVDACLANPHTIGQEKGRAPKSAAEVGVSTRASGDNSEAACCIIFATEQNSKSPSTNFFNACTVAYIAVAVVS
jgi:hypothetical protein